MGGPASIPFISCIPRASFEHEKAAAAEHPRLTGGPQGPAPAGSNPSSCTIYRRSTASAMTASSWYFQGSRRDSGA